MLLNFSLKKSIGHAINNNAEIYAQCAHHGFSDASLLLLLIGQFTMRKKTQPMSPGWDARAHAHFAFLIPNKFVNK